MYQVAIYCPHPTDETSISETLEVNFKLPIFTVNNAKALKDLISHKSINLMVYDTPVFTMADFEYLRDLKSLSLSAPVLVVTRKVEKDPIQLSAERQRFVVMERPFEVKDLLGVSRKLLHYRHAGQRIHRRFYTVEKAKIETFTTGESFDGSLLNVSRGGAYCETAANPRLSLGDLVRLNVDLYELGREYVFYAKVVWTTRRGISTGGPGIGLQFIKSSDVYTNLMKKM
jgi:hypothetical protein